MFHDGVNDAKLTEPVEWLRERIGQETPPIVSTAENTWSDAP